MTALREKLQPLIRGEVYDDEKRLREASHDASLFEVKPQLVVAPYDSEDLKALVRFANENPGISLTARSGATDMSGGPLNESVILDFTKHFNQVREVGDSPRSSSVEAGGYAVTQPGVFYRDFEKRTLEKGWLMPSYPASREICTVGGMVANNAGGEKTFSYGQTKDYVDKLKVVLADGNEYELKPLNKSELETKISQGDFEGNLYQELFQLLEENYDIIKQHKPRVSKNSAGYFLWDVWDRNTFDITKLFTGSQGTLGLISKITFRLIKPKPHSKLLVIFLHDLKPLGSIADAVVECEPESFESYDDKTLKLALRFLPDFISYLGKNLITLAIDFLPEFWMFLTGGMPRLVLMAEFTGDTEDEVDEKLQRAQKAIKPFKLKHRITTSEEDAKKYWTIRRESFNLLRKHIKGKRTAPFIDDMVVKPEYLPDFLPKLEELLKPYNLTYSVAGHVGDGNFHIIPLITIGDPKIKEIIPELSKKVYDLVLQFHGSITGEHNDGLIRTPFLKQMYGEQIYALFERVKKLFDPKNIFNPGKKTGGSFEYAMKHVQG